MLTMATYKNIAVPGTLTGALRNAGLRHAGAALGWQPSWYVEATSVWMLVILMNGQLQPNWNAQLVQL